MAPDAEGQLDPVVGADGIGDRLYPTLGSGGFDVERYRFDIEVSAAGEVRGTAGIAIVPTDDLSGFSLDLSGLTATSVAVDGVQAEFAQQDRELEIIAPEVLVMGASAQVVVDYFGVPQAVAAGAVPFAPGWQTGDDVFYLFSQPDGASSLFPVNDHPRDRADVELSVTVPSGWSAISGGVVTSESSTESAETVVWEMTEVAPYLIPLAIGRFDLVSEEAIDGVTYDVWVSEDLVGRVELEPFGRQAEIVAFFEERFGPYPFDRAGALIVDDDFPAALETQTIPTYTATSAGWGEVVIAHELAHQWFGDAIALEQWDDIWLNEGFATFAHWLWIEESFGEAAYVREVRSAYETFSGLDLVERGVEASRAVERALDAFPPPDAPAASDLFNPSVYERGALTLVALRDEVGDEALFEFFATYTSRFSGKTVTTESFLDLVAVELGEDVEALVRAWVQDDLVPPQTSLDLAPPG